MSWTDFALKLGVPSGGIGLVSDVMIFVIPFAAIIPLELSTAKKVGACLIFLTGGRYVDSHCVLSGADRETVPLSARS